MRAFTILAAAVSVGFAVPAVAATFTGQDDGSAVGGAMPFSDAAATDYLASATTYGPVTTVTFDSSPTQDVNSYAFPGLTITKTGPLIGNGFSGVSDTTNGNVYGYDQSAGGAGKWFGFPVGDATLTFSAPTNSIGFYISGTQATFGTDFTVTIDGTTFDAPVNMNGGAGFFGYTSDTAFSTVTISRLNNDAWGLDNLSYNFAGVPEPMTWAMMVVGFGVVGAAMRRRAVKLSYS